MVGWCGTFCDPVRQLSSAISTRLEKGLTAIDAIQQEMLWVQSSFTVLTIIAFGTLTLALHTELLQGDRAALGLSCFIGIYWMTRILVDAIYFSHRDWPKGTVFVVGHALLTMLFSFMAAVILGYLSGACG